ncbi:hypothetical protein [Pseudooceanicola algae]|uniref:Uncharacterized protein n=1 Tax=Pseudooceanicola algae TaxID=1537215 RepID=A0A418SL21_9RHOB|nr:hypothetical protein [Pseudooceanicola algae]QPM90883.1 hypothetical protein PSAL_021250 [Pseudooceanicola algae]
MNANFETHDLGTPGLDKAGPLDGFEYSSFRNPGIVMQPERLAAFQPSRISASRALIAQMIRERWSFRCKRFSIARDGLGEALYEVEARGYVFSFPIYSFRPSKEGRTGRIIGTAWDMMGAMVEGRLSDADFAATRRELPKLYRGRATPLTLTWFRANRSGRVFDRCVEALAKGQQPEPEMLWKAGYTMRNTGLDGNGTFGTRSFVTLEKDHPLRWALSAQMLSAYMMRVFAADLVDHFAQLDGGDQAVTLAPGLRRYLGVGNGSALGLMYFVNNRPKLVNRWIWIREKSIARAKMLDVAAEPALLDRLADGLDRLATFRAEDMTEYGRYPKSGDVAQELQAIAAEVRVLKSRLHAAGAAPLAAFSAALEGRYSDHAVESCLSALIDLVPEYAQAQVQSLVVDEEVTGTPEMTVGQLRKVLGTEYGWCWQIDLQSTEANHFIWYKSRNAEEPRRGPRKDIDAKHGLGLDLPRLVLTLDAALAGVPADTSIARFLVAHPDLRQITTRVQSLAGMTYHSPHANIMAADFVPAHITKCLNSGLHGLDKTVDSLDRVIRGILFQGAPLPEEVMAGTACADWSAPPRSESIKQEESLA